MTASTHDGCELHLISKNTRVSYDAAACGSGYLHLVHVTIHALSRLLDVWVVHPTQCLEVGRTRVWGNPRLLQIGGRRTERDARHLGAGVVNQK